MCGAYYLPKRLLRTGYLIASFFVASDARADELEAAKAQADLFVRSRFTIGQDQTAFTRNQIGPVPGFGGEWTATYSQVDGLRWGVKDESLSRADQLNGVTWKGFIGVNATAYRYLSERHNDPFAQKPCWSSWKAMPKWADHAPNDLTWSLVLINGSWKRGGSENSGHWFTDPFGEGSQARSEQDIRRVLSFEACT